MAPTYVTVPVTVAGPGQEETKVVVVGQGVEGACGYGKDVGNSTDVMLSLKAVIV